MERGWIIGVEYPWRPPRPLPASVASFLEGLEVEGRRVWVPERLPEPGSNRFFAMRHDLRVSSGFKWENKPPGTIAQHGGNGYGFSILNETPIVRMHGDLGLFPFDLWEWYGRWVVSAHAFDLFQSFDPPGIEAVKLDFAHANGERPSEAVYWLDFRRGMHAYDVEKSNLIFSRARTGELWTKDHAATVINPLIDTDLHVFREGGGGGAQFVSAELRAAIESAELKKVWFQDYAKGKLLTH